MRQPDTMSGSIQSREWGHRCPAISISLQERSPAAGGSAEPLWPESEPRRAQGKATRRALAHGRIAGDPRWQLSEVGRCGFFMRTKNGRLPGADRQPTTSCTTLRVSPWERLPALGLFAPGLVQSKGQILVGRNAVFKFFLDTSESALKFGHYPERVHPCNRCGTAEAIRHGCRIVRRVRWLGVQPRGLPIPI